MLKNREYLKICMFGQKRVPSREGGVEVVVEELAKRIVQKGHEVTCYNRSGHHVSGKEFDGKKIYQFKNVRIKTVPTIQKKGLAAVTSSFFASCFCAVGKYDVIHIHAEGPAAFCWIPKLFGKRVVVTIHGLDYQRAKWGRFASWYILCGEKSAVRFADEIIVLSKGVQNYFMETYGRKTVFIPNGVQTKPKHAPDQITHKWGLEKDGYILYMGRLVPEKGCHYLIEAFKQCKTNKKLVIAGGSSDTSEYEHKIRAMTSGDERIIFTGFVQGRVKHELFSNSYIYTLPSDLEGMPLTLLEGMSYGNCCLVSDIAECAEVVEGKGVLFKKSNVDDLRDKLQSLCNHPEIVSEYKKGSMEFIINKYGWDKIVNRTIKLYQNE